MAGAWAIPVASLMDDDRRRVSGMMNLHRQLAPEGTGAGCGRNDLRETPENAFEITGSYIYLARNTWSTIATKYWKVKRQGFGFRRRGRGRHHLAAVAGHVLRDWHDSEDQ